MHLGGKRRWVLLISPPSTYFYQNTVNGMIANPSKHQGMILGKTDHQFNFSVNDSVELFGVTIDKDLTFKQHVSSICKKVNNEFSVMTRFGKLMSTATMLRLYKAFILPHFYYFSIYGVAFL